jgi:hypothetical protein
MQWGVGIGICNVLGKFVSLGDMDISLWSKKVEKPFLFYLLLGGVWKWLAFKRDDGVAEIYQAVTLGTVIEVAMEEGSPRPRLQLLVEVDGRSRWDLLATFQGANVVSISLYLC